MAKHDLSLANRACQDYATTQRDGQGSLPPQYAHYHLGPQPSNVVHDARAEILPNYGDTQVRWRGDRIY